MNPLLKLSATELAARIRRRELSSREAVEAHIEHIERVNPVINAVVRERFARAREEADAADLRLKEGDTDDLPVFHGVPCTIKECFALEGMPNSSGLLARKHVVAQSDASAVGRLRKAGAIPLGVTNTSELCMWYESYNHVYGMTNNPYDPARMVGGSSGGEGAIIGAGGSPFGLGSDIGGSIRMPAFFNGVFGHKPSAGLVPGTGQYPIAHGVALRYLSTGPLARRAEDLMPLLRVMAGPDGVDSGCEQLPLGDPASVSIQGLKVLDIEDFGPIRVHKDLRDAQQKAVQALKRRGAVVERVRFDDLRHAWMIWGTMLAAAGGPTFTEILGDGRKVRPFLEFFRWIFRLSDFTLPSIMVAMGERFTFPESRLGKRQRARAQELRAAILSQMGHDGVFLFPSHRRPAPRHHHTLATPFNFFYTAIFNVLEMPITQVPLGLNASGIPVGVQVGAAHGQDHRTIAVAQVLEQELGGWVPPARFL